MWVVRVGVVRVGLCRHDGKTMDAIFTAYCKEERAKLRNPSAFFMALAKKVRSCRGAARSWLRCACE
jgi:hypothetical protein